MENRKLYEVTKSFTADVGDFNTGDEVELTDEQAKMYSKFIKSVEKPEAEEGDKKKADLENGSGDTSQTTENE